VRAPRLGPVLLAWYFATVVGPDAPRVVGPYWSAADCESARRFAEAQAWQPPKLVSESPPTWVQFPPPNIEPCYWIPDDRGTHRRRGVVR
jgi:hypothetical protein